MGSRREIGGGDEEKEEKTDEHYPSKARDPDDPAVLCMSATITHEPVFDALNDEIEDLHLQAGKQSTDPQQNASIKAEGARNVEIFLDAVAAFYNTSDVPKHVLSSKFCDPEHFHKYQADLSTLTEGDKEKLMSCHVNLLFKDVLQIIAEWTKSPEILTDAGGATRIGDRTISDFCEIIEKMGKENATIREMEAEAYAGKQAFESKQVLESKDLQVGNTSMYKDPELANAVQAAHQVKEGDRVVFVRDLKEGTTNKAKKGQTGKINICGSTWRVLKDDGGMVTVYSWELDALALKAGQLSPGRSVQLGNAFGKQQVGATGVLEKLLEDGRWGVLMDSGVRLQIKPSDFTVI